MQVLATIIYIFAQIVNPTYPGMMAEVVVTAPRYEGEDIAYSGMMPEVIVNAPRYKNEDLAWTGLMPETVVTAPRFEGEDIAYSGMMPEVVVIADRSVSEQDNGMLQTRYADYQKDESQRHVLNLDIEPKLAYAQLIEDFDFTFTDLTFSGDYNLAEGDTIDEDVTVTGGNASIDGVIDGDLAVMGGAVDVNGLIDGEVAVFGGNMDIMGTVTGDAAVFGGHVFNKGIIQGDLSLVGGTVTLDSGSVVEGDINMVGGSVERDTNAIVLGKIESIEFEALEKILPRIGRIGKAFKWTKTLPGGETIGGLVGIAVLFLVYILNLLVLLIFPRAIDRVVGKIQHSAWAAVGLGLALQILFVPLIILFAVSVIGIPLIPVFVLAVLVAILFGVSSVSLIIGNRIIKGFNWKIESRFGIFSIGWIAIMFILILGFILQIFGLFVPPVMGIGGIVIYVATTIGIGGTIYALVKREAKTGKK